MPAESDQMLREGKVYTVRARSGKDRGAKRFSLCHSVSYGGTSGDTEELRIIEIKGDQEIEKI